MHSEKLSNTLTSSSDAVIPTITFGSTSGAGAQSSHKWLPLWAYVIIAVAGLISLFVIVLLLIWKFVIKHQLKAKQAARTNRSPSKDRPMTESISTRFNATVINKCVDENQAQHDVSMLESVSIIDNPAYESAM
ncbi:uncharacterized protein LOC134177498 [Corticium candelabrum]|uniref:uncharacterized protein LOC134177498 n=1 Tax=Corticium candelabrum TaxID=121492 RepID=UPI002E26687A|nr:uncharacterized protein LOC134177498 [Corticium candelabrum]